MSEPRYAFEDFAVGSEWSLGSKKVEASEIIDFASQFDPQPFHLDEAAGKASILGGLAASGWHTVSMFMRMMCDAYLLDSTSQGAPGIDYARWRAPVLAGDMLTGKTTVIESRVSKSKPSLGFVVLHHEVCNQDGVLVCELQNTGMFSLREPVAS